MGLINPRSAVRAHHWELLFSRKLFTFSRVPLSLLWNGQAPLLVLLSLPPIFVKQLLHSIKKFEATTSHVNFSLLLAETISD